MRTTINHTGSAQFVVFSGFASQIDIGSEFGDCERIATIMNENSSMHVFMLACCVTQVGSAHIQQEIIQTIIVQKHQLNSEK